MYTINTLNLQEKKKYLKKYLLNDKIKKNVKKKCLSYTNDKE